MTMITPSYLGETIEYSSLHACRSTLEDPMPAFEPCSSVEKMHFRRLRKSSFIVWVGPAVRRSAR